MDHQYVDMYLRKKKGYTGSSGIPIPVQETVSSGSAAAAGADSNGGAAGIDRQVDRVVRGSFSVQQFVDRTDALSLQVETFEDKIINLTKLVKLSQALQDEKESDLRKQNHELKARLKRQEQITAKLSADFDTFKSQVTTLIRETVMSTTAPLIDDLQAHARATQDNFAEQEKRLQNTKEALSESLMQQADGLLTRRLGQLHETSISVMQQQTARNQTQLEQVEKRLDTLDNHRLVELRRAFEDRLTAAIQLARDSILSETKSNMHLHLDKLQDEFSNAQTAQENTKLRLSNLERQSSAMDSAFTDFLSTFKDSTKLHSSKTEELSASVKEFVSLHEQTRSVVEAELESTKQWATRNLHRLKKHIDVINSDLLALRESHVETSSQVQRVKCHVEAEHEKLLALLQQKSKEANILTEIVDKEIQSIQQITSQHRSAGGHQHHVSAAAFGAQDNIASQRTATGTSLYDELAFTRRPTAGSQ